jgi:hypothetical protein
MTTQTPSSDLLSPFTPEEQRVLYALRRHYQQDRDLFSPSELARLRFLRWLVQTGRLPR